MSLSNASDVDNQRQFVGTNFVLEAAIFAVPSTVCRDPLYVPYAEVLSHPEILENLDDEAKSGVIDHLEFLEKIRVST